MDSVILFLCIGLVCAHGLSMPGPLIQLGRCNYKGKIYEDGEVISSNPCNPKTCHRGYVPQIEIDCPNPHCVNSVVQPGHCCASCPTGRNCRLPDRSIMPADKPKILEDGRICRCQHSFGFGFRPINPNAICSHPRSSRAVELVY